MKDTDLCIVPTACFRELESRIEFPMLGMQQLTISPCIHPAPASTLPLHPPCHCIHLPLHAPRPASALHPPCIHIHNYLYYYTSTCKPIITTYNSTTPAKILQHSSNIFKMSLAPAVMPLYIITILLLIYPIHVLLSSQPPTQLD